MTENNHVLAEARSDHHGLLVDIAYRLLGSFGDAEGVAQEAFAKLQRHSGAPIADPRAWLVVVVTRQCLDQLGSARIRRAAYVGPWLPEPVVEWEDGRTDPARLVTLDESVRMAFLVVLERLAPAERIVFVLHDAFDVPFTEVATIVERSAPACRQLVGRARRRIEKDPGSSVFETDHAELRRVNAAFTAACATGEEEALLRVLDPSVAGWTDAGGALPSARRPTVGAREVATASLRQFRPESGATLEAGLVNGEPGIIAVREASVCAVLVPTVSNGLMTRLHAQADPRKLTRVQYGYRSAERQ